MPTTTLHVLYTPPWRALMHVLADTARRLGRRAWQRLLEAERRRAERAVLRQLLELDNHLLRDLGVDRSELLSMAAHPGDATRRRSVAVPMSGTH